MQKYSMIVFSNYMDGKENEYIDWYCGQHIHDLMRIPGFVGSRFYRLSDSQLYPDMELQFRYMMIWDWETDDVQGIFDEIRARKEDGRTVFADCFDKKMCTLICLPVMEHITDEQVRGMSVQETLAFVDPDRTTRG